jgi:predicted PurR-regulated permease PerM
MNFVISTRTIFTVLLLFFLLWASFQIKEIIVTVFVSALLSLALVPLIKRLEDRKVSRFFATLIVYAVVVITTLLLLVYGFSPMVEQTLAFFSQLPRILDIVLANPLVEPIGRQLVGSLTTQISAASGGLVQVTLNVFSSFVSLVTVVVFSFYFSFEFDSLKKKLLKLLVTEEAKKKFEHIISEVEVKIGSWVRGELILGLVIGIMTYVGLSILRVNYAVPLAIIAGILEIIPMIGPIISAVPAAVVGFSASPVLGLGIVALFILIQQIENTIIVPKVMQKAVDLDPILTLLVILVGGKLFGILGALLAVPVTLVVFIILKYLYYKTV